MVVDGDANIQDKAVTAVVRGFVANCTTWMALHTNGTLTSNGNPGQLILDTSALVDVSIDTLDGTDLILTTTAGRAVRRGLPRVGSGRRTPSTADRDAGRPDGRQSQGGLEDSLWIGRGKLAPSNAGHVQAARRIVESPGLAVATPDEAWKLLALKGGEKVAF